MIVQEKTKESLIILGVMLPLSICLCPSESKNLKVKWTSALLDLERISGSLSKIDQLGSDLSKVADVLGKLADLQDNQVQKGFGSKEYVA